jgi:hydroxypyruvate reductase 1
LLSAGVLTETTAEIAAALTLAAARRVVEADRFMRNGHYKGWLPTLFIGNLLQNKTVRLLRCILCIASLASLTVRC